MTTNAIDVTSLCWSTLGIVLFVGYLRFAHSVTQRGDFYHGRRWKAALWFAGVPCLILFVIFLLSSITATFSNPSGKDTIDLIEFVIVAVLTRLAYMIPVLLVMTIGIHYSLKWWRNSDDFLDKIWKDPTKGQKNLVQGL